MSRDNKGYEVEKSTDGKKKIYKCLQYKTRIFKTRRVILQKIREVEHGNCQFEIGFPLVKVLS